MTPLADGTYGFQDSAFWKWMTATDAGDTSSALEPPDPDTDMRKRWKVLSVD